MLKKLLIAIFLAVTFVAKSQIITDRPDQTESTFTVPKGSLQIESGILFEYTKSEKKTLLPINLFRYGITKNIELRLLNQFESVKINQKSIEGISDIEIGTKIQLIKKSAFNLAFLTHLILPTGSKFITNNNYGSINKMSFSHSLTERINIGYNVGYDYIEDDISNDLTYSISLANTITEKVGIYIEPYGRFENLKVPLLNIDGGLTYLINNNLQLDFSFGTGVNYEMNYISLGCSWVIEAN